MSGCENDCGNWRRKRGVGWTIRKDMGKVECGEKETLGVEDVVER
jgi:hypothetical protein